MPQAGCINQPPLWRDLARFLLLSTAICLFLFWAAATGEKLLAPLDIAPTLLTKFKYVDPTANGVPANHYIVDMMLGDVSRNWIVYQAWQRGEMPWWDPYIDCGKPLAAEANAVNVSDPVKVLLFHLLPFELAYNWVRIVTFIISGLGAFCLLRHFGFCFPAAMWGGLLYQFAGGNAIMFSGPTVQASFSYLPWLWLMWDQGAARQSLIWFALSSPVAGLIFLSGNLQSHSYPFCLALAFLAGYGWGRPRRLGHLALGSGLSLALGLCLAAPFVFSQIELFLLSWRQVLPLNAPRGMLSGVLSLVTLFPWAFGTFRTLDASKLVGQYSLGFWPYIGSAALIIAVLGATAKRPAGARDGDLKRTAISLVVIYFVICSSPLLRVLYTRTAWLAVLGLVVLFAMGWQRLSALESPLKRWGWAVATLALLLAAAVNIGGGLVYPQYQPKVEAFVQKQSQNANLDDAPELRRFQVANFPREVTFRNREPLVAFIGMLALAAYLIASPKVGRQVWLWSILLLSTLPLLWFVQRFIPQQPVASWQKIREGGPEQRRVVEMVKARGLRLREVAPGQHEYVFPGALAEMFGVHVLHGHTSIGPYNASHATNASGGLDPVYHDVIYRSATRKMERGELEMRTEGPPARFHWATPSARPVEIESETLNTITLAIGPGPAGELIRTDTYFPGWRVAPGTPGVILSPDPPFSARISVPESVTRLQLIYQPRWLRAGIVVAVAAGVLVLFCLAVYARRRPFRIGAGPAANQPAA